ncbi:MAG: glycyl-radical enzyme activating protein [Anaerolineae bacterium]|nr:glycyl-radical enzyme activating protein [Anaerolineae bacterium]
MSDNTVGAAAQRDETEGVVFEIQRWSGNDGPGIRTVVFFKGCPLRCAWCCNPESWLRDPQIAFFASRCKQCGQCKEVCPQVREGDTWDEVTMKAASCSACGQCVEVCAAGARELMGRRMTVTDVLETIEKDRVFYRQSGGGVTFSGGEALAQAGFVRELVDVCWVRGIAMVLETSGYFSWDAASEILARMDLIFLDLKHMDSVVHQRLTGRDNRIILENAVRIASQGWPLVIRVPLVPGMNDGVENLEATAEFVACRLDGALGVEILPYHSLGQAKFAALGMAYGLSELDPPQAEAVERAREVFRRRGVIHCSASKSV